MARKKRVTYEMHGIDFRGEAYENMTKSQLAQLAAHEAKIANQRMRRLDAAGYGGANPASGAYKVVKSDISRWFPGAAKYSESAGVYERMRTSTVKAILRDLDYYKTLKTATVSGTRQVQKRRREAFESKTGLKFDSAAQYDRFWSSKVGDFLFEIFGSDTAIDFLTSSKKSLDDITKAVQEFKDRDTGDKDNADEVAKRLGYKSLADARKQTARTKAGQRRSAGTTASEITGQGRKKGGRNGRKGKR